MNSLTKTAMKKLNHILIASTVLLFAVSCEQELVDNTANPCPSNDPSIICPDAPAEECPTDASAGSADFSKFVAIGTSYTAGFQAGALFTQGQQRSVGRILAKQFECVGGGVFNQANIGSENGFNIFINPNPNGTTILGRFRLQGTPPQPAPVLSGTVGNSDALPSPTPPFQYTGQPGATPTEDLNDFSVPAIQLYQAYIATETGNWADNADPLFSPFFARMASAPGTTLVADAATSMAKNGTFFLFWLGMDDVLLNAAYGGDDSKAPLTPAGDFRNLYNGALHDFANANPDAKGVLVNYPNPFVMPHFTAVPWNAVPLDAATATMLNENLAANYNAFLDGMVGMSVITAEEAARRKLNYQAGQNAILLTDELLTDLSGEMVGPYAALAPYAQARHATATDIIPLSTAAVLGQAIDVDSDGEPDADAILGVSIPVADQYVLTPEESQLILSRLEAFNAHIKGVAEDDLYNDRVAFADIAAAQMAMIANMGIISDGVLLTPNINPPTGMYSEDGLHPNSRGYAFIANVIIDAINTKFGAKIPKANIGNYGATGLPINP